MFQVAELLGREQDRVVHRTINASPSVKIEEGQTVNIRLYVWGATST
jgi:hypothetical protein